FYFKSNFDRAVIFLFLDFEYLGTFFIFPKSIFKIIHHISICTADYDFNSTILKIHDKTMEIPFKSLFSESAMIAYTLDISSNNILFGKYFPVRRQSDSRCRSISRLKWIKHIVKVKICACSVYMMTFSLRKIIVNDCRRYIS